MESTVSNYQNGVFFFTNATDDDFIALWNNKEYKFPAKTTCPMLIQGEPPENVQEIRKKWAYKLAQREFFNGSEYMRLVAHGEIS